MYIVIPQWLNYSILPSLLVYVSRLELGQIYYGSLYRDIADS